MILLHYRNNNDTSGRRHIRYTSSFWKYLTVPPYNNTKKAGLDETLDLPSNQSKFQTGTYSISSKGWHIIFPLKAISWIGVSKKQLLGGLGCDGRRRELVLWGCSERILSSPTRRRRGAALAGMVGQSMNQPTNSSLTLFPFIRRYLTRYLHMYLLEQRRCCGKKRGERCRKKFVGRFFSFKSVPPRAGTSK